MQFYDYASYKAMTRKLPDCRRMSTRQLFDHVRAQSGRSGRLHIDFEEAWVASRRPYYDVYPAIIPMLLKLDLHFPGKLITPPNGLKHLILRLPKCDHDLRCKYDVAPNNRVVVVETIVLSFQDTEIGPSLVVIPMFDDSRDEVLPTLTVPRNDMLVEEVMEIASMDGASRGSVFAESPLSYEVVKKAIKLCMTVCLIGDNPEFIVREVLAKDAAKVEAASREDLERLYTKAVRCGKFGFSLGRDIEVLPHVRRPHPALMWTGKGRGVPRIVLRRGSIVHRDKIEQLPSGYLDE